MSRQIVLDTETTGLNVGDGHRVIEVGGVEIVDRRITGRHFHQYCNPDRAIEAGALEVHGISEEFLADKPRFAEVAGEFIDFITGAELVIHNAPFDVGFLDAEFRRLAQPVQVAGLCSVLDTLALARELHPGQRNSLDALCTRYQVDHSGRQLHGALLDAEILADVYLVMTGGQSDLGLSFQSEQGTDVALEAFEVSQRSPLQLLHPSDEELSLHEARLRSIEKESGHCLWLEM